MTIENLALQGRHTAFNTMAGGISAKLENIRKESIRQSFYDLDTVDHRMKVVANVRGIEFINDSRSSNVNSVWYTLEGISRPIIWIAGGIDKDNDYTELLQAAKHKVKALICIGVDNSKIKAAFSGVIDTIIETQLMHEAVESAFYLGQPGDVVLLSPACPSFDLFENFEERGNKFKRAVQDL